MNSDLDDVVTKMPNEKAEALRKHRLNAESDDQKTNTVQKHQR